MADDSSPPSAEDDSHADETPAGPSGFAARVKDVGRQIVKAKDLPMHEEHPDGSGRKRISKAGWWSIIGGVAFAAVVVVLAFVFWPRPARERFVAPDVSSWYQTCLSSPNACDGDVVVYKNGRAREFHPGAEGEDLLAELSEVNFATVDHIAHADGDAATFARDYLVAHHRTPAPATAHPSP